MVRKCFVRLIGNQLLSWQSLCVRDGIVVMAVNHFDSCEPLLLEFLGSSLGDLELRPLQLDHSILLFPSWFGGAFSLLVSDFCSLNNNGLLSRSLLSRLCWRYSLLLSNGRLLRLGNTRLLWRFWSVLLSIRFAFGWLRGLICNRDIAGLGLGSTLITFFLDLDLQDIGWSNLAS